MKPSDIFLGNDDESILKDKIELQDRDDEGQTDVESDANSSQDEDKTEDDITAGDVVWGMCGRMWYPDNKADNKMTYLHSHLFSV